LGAAWPKSAESTGPRPIVIHGESVGIRVFAVAIDAKEDEHKNHSNANHHANGSRVLVPRALFVDIAVSAFTSRCIRIELVKIVFEPCGDLFPAVAPLDTYEGGYARE